MFNDFLCACVLYTSVISGVGWTFQHNSILFQQNCLLHCGVHPFYPPFPMAVEADMISHESGLEFLHTLGLMQPMSLSCVRFEQDQ